jgi:hypothetical protein
VLTLCIAEDKVMEENNGGDANGDDDSDPDQLYVADMAPTAARPTPVAVPSNPSINPRSPRVIVSPRRSPVITYAPQPRPPREERLLDPAAPVPAQEGDPPAKRRPGRPPGTSKKPKTGAPSSRASSVASNDSQGHQKKKRPGRPVKPKAGAPSSQASSVASNDSQGHQTKKRPGRPAKPKTGAPSSQVSSVASNNSQGREKRPRVVKRKRSYKE